MRLTEQLLVQQIVLSRPRFPVKPSVLCKYITYYASNYCDTEVGEQPILFFCSLWKRAVVRAAHIFACLCRTHVGGYTAGVYVNINMSYACPSVGCPKSYRPLYFFGQSIRIEYASMTTLFNFQFPESLEISFCWDADVRPKSEIDSRILNFQPNKIWSCRYNLSQMCTSTFNMPTSYQ